MGGHSVAGLVTVALMCVPITRPVHVRQAPEFGGGARFWRVSDTRGIWLQARPLMIVVAFWLEAKVGRGFGF